MIAVRLACLLLALAHPHAYRLVDATGAPVAGARVSVQGATGSAVTDEAGVFVLPVEPRPPFEVVVFGPDGALLGAVQVDEAAASGDRTIVLPLLEQIRVTPEGAVAPSTPAPPAAAPTIVSRAALEDRAPSSVAAALEDVPGVTSSDPTETGVPSVRGMARGRTLVLLDDARVSAERRAGASATFLNPWTLESLEVVRGPGSVVYGSDALGGVIHGRTRLPRTGELAGAFELELGPGDGGGGGVELNVPLAERALLVQAHAQDVDSWRSATEDAPEASGESRGGLLRFFTPVGDARLHVGLQLDRTDDVTRPTSTWRRARTVYPTESSDRLTVAFDRPAGVRLPQLEVRAFLGRYRVVTDRVSPGDAPRATVRRADVDARDASLRVMATAPTGQGLVRGGLDVSGRFDLEARDLVFESGGGSPDVLLEGGRSVEDADRWDVGGFLEGQRALPAMPVQIGLGLRLDRLHSTNRGGAFGDRTRSTGALSGYGSVTVTAIPRWSGTLQLARGFRDPTLSDRYFVGVSGRGLAVGNPELDPERSVQWDLAVRGELGPVQLGAYGYRYRIDDVVERFEVEQEVFSFRNRGRERISGWELEASASLLRGLRVQGFVSGSRGRIVDDGSPAADVPALELGGGIEQRLVRFRWGARLVHVARDDRPAATEVEVPSYELLDANVGCALPRGLELRLHVRNVLDERVPASPDPNAALSPRREATLALAGTF